MNDTIVFIIFIMTASTIFPMVGYMLDRRHRKKMMGGKKTGETTGKKTNTA